MDIFGKTVKQLRDLIDKKEVSVDEVFDFFVKRIEKYNPKLNIYLTTVKNEIKPLGGKLFGIPLAIKDNFCTKGIRTTASSKVLGDFIPPYESTVTDRLKRSGAFLLGKTNMDAWAHGSSTETSDYGPTKNPWDVSRSPGGSSGGSAAAVSAYLAPAAIGSETAGSIKQPASWTGVVGLKPTYGRVSRYGVVAMESSLDCPGPMTLTVEDAALILEVIAGHDPYDATSSPTKTSNYLEASNRKEKMTIGICEDYFEGVTDEIKNKVWNAVKILEKQGHKTKKVKLISPKYAISVYTIIQRSGVSSNLGRYDGIRYGNDRNKFGEEAKRRVMLGTYTLSAGYYDAYYKKAQKVRTIIIEDFKNAFGQVDVIMAPTAPMTALKLGEFEKYPFFGEVMDQLNEPGAIAGVPAINIPVGLDENNLPIGMQIIGNYFEEGKILDIANQFEKETNFFDVIRRGINNYK